MLFIAGLLAGDIGSPKFFSLIETKTRVANRKRKIRELISGFSVPELDFKKYSIYSGKIQPSPNCSRNNFLVV